MTRRKWILSTAMVAGLALTAFGGVRLFASAAERPDCPGKIVCPLTGKLVCKDRCPLSSDSATASKADTKVPCSCCKKGA
jgi:hypothetical protein